MQMIDDNRLQIESLKSEIKTLSTQKQAEKITRELTQLTSSVNNKNESSDILQIRKELNSLENKLNNSSMFTTTTTISKELQEEIDDLRNELNILKQKLNNQVNVDISTLRNRLEPLILLTIQKIIDQPINNLVNRPDLENINDERFKYKLIFGRTESRERLREALQDAKERIIMVCPWITDYGLSDRVKADIMKSLEDNVKIDVGWGRLTDIEALKEALKRDGYICNLSDTSETLQNHSNRTSLYNAVSQLTDLQQSYPKLLSLKLIGTHEKFLVCDRSWALITSHNFLTSDGRSDEREIGLWTNDESIISQLIDQYDNAPDLSTSV
jgi:phosphatidylserine/phosphatidylglycerophosphate/cardiolipin synthase-like enzyme